MTTPQSQFMSSIIERPDDDAPRLAFADWFEQNNQPERAEFIRLQCKLALLPRYAPGRRALAQREDQLLHEFGKTWAIDDGLDSWINVAMVTAHVRSARFRRGFVEFARLQSPKTYQDIAEALCQRTPVRELELRTPYTFTSAAEEQQANDASWREVCEGCGFHYDRDPGAVLPAPSEFQEFVRSSWFHRLRFLGVSGDFNRLHLEILLSEPNTSCLRGLDLSSWGNLIYGAGWAPFANTKFLGELETLKLDGCELKAEGLRFLARAKVPNLRRLSMIATHDNCGEAGDYAILSASPNFPKLEDLILRGQWGGSKGLRVLADWPGLKRLVRLEVSDNYRWGDDDYGKFAQALGELVHSRNWGDLRELNLDGTAIPRLDSLQAVVSAPNLSSLRVLTLDTHVCEHGNGKGPCQDTAADLLVGCPHLAKDLELRFCEGGLSAGAKERLKDRFGDDLILYPNDGMSHFRE